MTDEWTGQVAATFEFPVGVIVSTPAAEQRSCSTVPNNEIYFPLHAFVYGLWLPVPVSIMKIFRVMNLAPAQFDPNGLRAILASLVL